MLTMAFGDLAVTGREEDCLHRARRNLRDQRGRWRRCGPRHANAVDQSRSSRGAPDSRRLMYTSNRDGAWHVYLYDFTRTKRRSSRADASTCQARWSPDGKQLAFVRDARNCTCRWTSSAVASSRAARFASAVCGNGTIAWSPDGKFIAYLPAGTKLMLNAYVAAVAGGDGAAGEQVVLATPVREGSPWSRDGTYLMLASACGTEPAISREWISFHSCRRSAKISSRRCSAIRRRDARRLQRPHRRIRRPIGSPDSSARGRAARRPT